MQALIVAIGNELRGDDGVAFRVVELLPSDCGLSVCGQQQLTPEVAAELGAFGKVVFLDADPTAVAPTIEPVEPGTASTISHAMSPGAVVLLARSLYGWRGDAWLCRLPAREFEAGACLSSEAEANIASAAALVGKFLEQRCTSPR